MHWLWGEGSPRPRVYGNTVGFHDKVHLHLTNCSHDNGPLLLQLPKHGFGVITPTPHSKRGIRTPILQLEKLRPSEVKPPSPLQFKSRPHSPLSLASGSCTSR